MGEYRVRESEEGERHEGVLVIKQICSVELLVTVGMIEEEGHGKGEQERDKRESEAEL